jgi:hypothetical protein
VVGCGSGGRVNDGPSKGRPRKVNDPRNTNPDAPLMFAIASDVVALIEWAKNPDRPAANGEARKRILPKITISRSVEDSDSSALVRHVPVWAG